MLNIGAIARSQTVRQFQQMGTDILSIRSQSVSGMPLAYVQAVPANVGSIQQVAPLVLGGGSISFEGTSSQASEIGVTEAYASIARLQVAQGRFITDLDKFELYCVVGSQLAGVPVDAPV